MDKVFALDGGTGATWLELPNLEVSFAWGILDARRGRARKVES